MGKQFYKATNFKAESLALIDTVNKIVDDYIAQGYRLTVRQLYYQLVSKAIVENTEKSYKRITGLVNDGKLAGLIDWEAIEDRTRDFIRRSRWSGGASILQSAAEGFHMDMWEGQYHRPFVIVEKEALAGVLERACSGFDVPLLAARGYPSGTVLREFVVEDVLPALGEDQTVTVIHLGDHDPSGIDMTRDLRERIELFTDNPVKVDRIALNMDQIDEQQPPPNPAKTTDSRFDGYVRKFGDESWELDALKPQYLNDIVRERVTTLIDTKLWKNRQAEIEGIKTRIRKAAKTFE
jgi:hypothetical protein